MSDNGIATAQDFRQAAETESFSEPERVVLPKSGLPVLLRRPRAIFFALLRGRLPKGLAAVATNTAESLEAKPNIDEIQQLAGFWAEVFAKVFVEPRLSLTPGPEEIDPNWLLTEDCEFLFKWVIGEVATSGRDLARFRPKPGSAAVGAGGGDVSLPPKPSAPGDSNELAD